MTEITELLDLSRTRAAALFEGRTYPWEVLDGIGDFIRALGPTLPAEEFEQVSEGVWIARDATVYPSAYIGAPCIIDHGAEVRHGAFIRGSAITIMWATRSWATRPTWGPAPSPATSRATRARWWSRSRGSPTRRAGRSSALSWGTR